MVRQHESERARLDEVTAELDPPFAVLDLEAFDRNARDLARRAQGVPIRVASKSLRCRWAVDRALSSDACQGVMAFTLPEALWLAEQGYDDLVVGYPTVDRAALVRLCADEAAAARITLMVDHPDQLDIVDAVAAPRERPAIKVCLDIDASLHLFEGRVKVGVRRSPIHGAGGARRLAEVVVGRRGFVLDGVMAYEAQVAGVGDDPLGQPWRRPAIRSIKRRSVAQIEQRRGEVVAAVRQLADLRFVNGGGTGSLETTAADPVVTEVTAGSGFYAPGLFDAYAAFRLEPAALFALPVVRRPGPGVVTLLGGGYLASGPGDSARLPHPYLPSGLSFTSTEGAGEVQTPVVGEVADRLEVGDRVWLRHAKAGELCERIDRLHLIDGRELVGDAPTYRGDGVTFL